MDIIVRTLRLAAGRAFRRGNTAASVWGTEYNQKRAAAHWFVIPPLSEMSNDIVIVAVAHGKRKPGYWEVR